MGIIWSGLSIKNVIISLFSNIEYFNEAAAEAKRGENGELIQDGEIEQQNFGSGFAESNESIISFESPSMIETQKSVILSNVSNVEETFEEKMDSSEVILGGC